jgi:signal transduction histidine kinase
MRSSFREAGPSVRFAGGVIAVLLLALVTFYLVMQPQVGDLKLIAFSLTATSVVTWLAGYVAHRLGWIGRVPSLRWALFGTYAISSVLTFFNVWMTARLMFFNDHDLILGIILLLFASGIAMTLGYFFTETLARRIAALSAVAREIPQGGFDARVSVDGNDEIADLAGAFNDMLEQLESAENKQREMEDQRRELIAWVGHDLQTPLASMRAIVEALADDMVVDPEVRRRYLETAKRDIRSLSQLIDDLFELAQLDAGGLTLDIEPNSFSDVVSDTLESFSAIAVERGITLHGEVKGDLDSVPMDARRIGRVLANLVSNALRHTPKGGDVLLRARLEGGWIRVDVVDTGEGISSKDLPYLFDRFYRSEKSRSQSTGGAGLGLAIAKGFVEAHGGRISADLAEEGGAHFRVAIPVA